MPDAYRLGLMPADQLTAYFEISATEAHSYFSDGRLLKLCEALHLLFYDNPRVPILEIGNDVAGSYASRARSLTCEDVFRKVRILYD